MSNPISIPAPPPANRPIPVALARALAEAADGFPRAEPFYLLASYEARPDTMDFELHGPFASWDQVPEALRVRVGQPGHRGLGFFGPYDTSAAVVGRGERVQAVDLHLRNAGLRLPGRVDTLFFSASAVEKFALPYYARIYGLQFADLVKQQFQSNTLQVMAHFPWSEYTDPPKPPEEAHRSAGAMLLHADGPRGPELVPVAGTGTIPLTRLDRR